MLIICGQSRCGISTDRTLLKKCKPTFRIIHIMDNRQTNDLRYSPEQALKGPKGRKRTVVIGQRRTKHHESGDELRPEPDREAVQSISLAEMIMNGRAEMFIPSISLNERDRHQPTDPLQEQPVVHCGSRLVDGDAPV